MSGAVFLSYASQDAETARRICESLRTAGVEVWFDVEGGLETGDEWDAKIRKQIKECVLFVPIISANTQARLEGYFRLEWELAAQRAMSIASGVPFILPVVIDDTREPEALVPDRFRTVQWTRLPRGVASPEVLGRLVKLWSHRAGVAKHEARRPAATADPSAEPVRPPTAPGKPVATSQMIWGGAAIAATLGLAGYFWSKRLPEGASNPGKTELAEARPAPAATAPAARHWPRSAELKRVIALIDGLEATMEDFRLAEEIATRAVTQAPTDPETVTVMARVHSAFVMRNFDFSAERTAIAKKYGERAVQLAPDEPEALLALAIFLTDRGANAARGAELAKRATEQVPGEPRFWRAYARAVESTKRLSPEGLALMEQNVARFPRDVLAHYELSIAYRNRERWAEFERELDATLALAPLANAINWKARAALLRGDLAEMRQWLDRVPARARTEERTVINCITYSRLSGDYAYGLEALQGFAEPWFYDAFNYSGPAALPRAEMLMAQGKPGLARVHYEAALAEINRRKAESPADFTGRAAEIWSLLGLGRREEALALHRTAMEAARRPWRVTGLASWSYDTIPRALLLGDRETAVALIREAAAEPEGRRVIQLRMSWDARMAPFRLDPEIARLLADPAPAPEAKKAAVTGAPPSEAAQLSARALAAFTKVGFLREDLVAGEDFARRATELEPASAAAWGVRAGVQSAWIFRNWDSGDKRRQDTQAHANRALALDPDEPEALLALAVVLRRQGAFEQAVALLRRACAAHPDHLRLGRQLGFTLSSQGNNAEARTVLRALVARYPRDPLLRYDLATCLASYGPGGNSPTLLAGALEEIDASLAIQPFSSALVLKAVLVGGWRGDLAASRAAMNQLEKMPLGDRAEDRAVFLAMWLGLVEQRPDRVEAAAALTARSYFEDSLVMLRPKAWSLALAHQLAGKENTARADWQAAEGMLRQRLKDEPGNQIYQVELAATLAWLSQREEALRLLEPVEAVWKEGLNWGRARLLALAYAALGDPARAAPYLPQVIDQSPFTSRHVIQHDPWWMKIRASPEFSACLRESGGNPTGSGR